MQNFTLIFTDPILFIKKLIGKVKRSQIYKLYILRDDQYKELARWSRDGGDNALRYNYPDLNEKSIVFDLGGYKGDFAYYIHEKYKCKVYLFEPHPNFYEHCLNRFMNNDQITVLNYGLLDKDGEFNLTHAKDGSSFYTNPNLKITQEIKCKVKEFFGVLEELQISEIDLMKINIEGGEYPLLQHISSKLKLDLIKQYQIQFHKWIKNSVSMRKSISSELAKTHIRTWCYNFVWENWKNFED